MSHQLSDSRSYQGTVLKSCILAGSTRSNKAISVDVRVLAATHRNLDTLIGQGKFRQDLLYRLSVVPIQMPSPRERADDIPVLVDYFIGRFGEKSGKTFRTIDKRTAELFESYQWP